MEEWIKTVFTLVTGFTGGFWTHRFTVRRESEKRRHAFREKLRQIEFKFQTLEGHDWPTAYKSSIDEVRNAAASVYEDIPSGKLEAFRKAWKAYCSKDDEAIEPTFDVDAAMKKYVTGDLPEADYGNTKTVIFSRLRALINAAN